jgi:UDP-N-acetylmuramate dehydrogenase
VIRQNVSLASYTSWQVGGSADWLSEPTSEIELEQAIKFAVEKSLPINVLGGGTNVLISDRGIRGLVIALRKFSGLNTRVHHGRFQVEALSGTSKSELLRAFLKAKLEPAVFLAGIPGDVGGGVVMNAGVSEMMTPREFVEITDRIEVWNWDSRGVISKRQIDAKNLNWSYRHCEGWRPGILVRAWFSWKLEPREDTLSRVRNANQARLTKQPLDLPSCGSVFVNPPNDRAGRLIESCGLKGFAIGAAKVSEKHANFIVNTGGATATDMSAVIEYVQKKVLMVSGVKLKTEVIWLGDWA